MNNHESYLVTWLRRVAMCGLTSVVGIGAGCSTTNPFSSARNELMVAPQKSSVLSANLPKAGPIGNPTNQSLGQPAAGVVPASYVDPAAGRPVPAQLAGLRRHVADSVGSGSGCGCGSSSDVCSAECGECTQCQAATQGYDASEFVCDGGDRDPVAIVREDWSAAGIDTTDTVIYYETLGGKVCIQPSNRTCIYAPRFGAVRQVTGATLAENVLPTNRVVAPVAANNVQDRNLAGNVALAAKPIGQRQVQLLDRLHDETRGIGVDMVVPPTPVETVVSPMINVDRALVDVALSNEWVDLISRNVEVGTLINPESLGVYVAGQEAVAVVGTKRTAEFYLYETPDKCSMRIIKTASHQMASPGDRIRFTIRFENVGSQKLGNAVILDSLSPRLNYIEGSQQCSVDARFSIEPNEAGSRKLRWDIQSPIAAQQGGVISFDCEVR